MKAIKKYSKTLQLWLHFAMNFNQLHFQFASFGAGNLHKMMDLSVMLKLKLKWLFRLPTPECSRHSNKLSSAVAGIEAHSEQLIWTNLCACLYTRSKIWIVDTDERYCRTKAIDRCMGFVSVCSIDILRSNWSIVCATIDSTEWTVDLFNDNHNSCFRCNAWSWHNRLLQTCLRQTTDLSVTCKIDRLMFGMSSCQQCQGTCFVMQWLTLT